MRPPCCRAFLLAAVLTASVIVLTVRTSFALAPSDNEPRPWLAQPGGGPAPAAATAPERTSWRSTIVAALALLLGGAAFFARKFGRFGPKLPESSRLRILSSVRVGPKGHVILIAIGERNMLLGATNTTIRRLAWIDGEQVNASPAPADEAEKHVPPARASNFGGLLRGLVRGGARKPDASPASAPSTRTAVERTGQGKSALAAANETTDVVDWSPRMKAGQGMRPDKTADVEGGRATDREEPSKSTEAMKELQIEGQATGLLGRNPRRRT